MRMPVFLLVLAGAAACGGSDPAATNPPPPPPPPSGPPTSVAVSVRDYSYSPAGIIVKVGGVVTWTNRGTVGHTVTGSSISSGTLGAPGGGSYGGTAGDSYQQTFGTAGAYDYHCAFHAQMTGTVTVVP